MFYPINVFISLRYINLKNSKFFSFLSLFSIISIALGILSLVVALSLTNGLQNNTKNRVLKDANHAIVKIPENENYQTLKTRILQNKNWIQVEEYLLFDAMILFNNKMQSVEIEGVNNNLKSNEAIISQDIQYTFNLKIGDNISVIVPKETEKNNIEPTIYSLKIVDISNNKSLIQTNVNFAYSLRFNNEKIQFLRLKADDINKVMDYIQDHIFQNLEIQTYLNKFASLFAAMELEKFMISLILCFLIALASLNIISLLVILVKEKQTNIAILRTMGAKKNDILKIFITQGMFIGTIGIILGLILGLLISLNINEIIVFINKNLNDALVGVSHYFGDNISSIIKFTDIFYLISWTFFIIFISTLYPAYKASLIEPAISINK